MAILNLLVEVLYGMRKHGETQDWRQCLPDGRSIARIGKYAIDISSVNDYEEGTTNSNFISDKK